MAAAVMASSMGFIDSSVTAIALPAMRASLGGTLAQAQWVSGAYLLTLSSLILVGGATSDRFGIVRVFVWGILVFVASSALCAVAQSLGQMNLARAVQGIGAAFMVPGSMVLVSRAYPREARGAALGLWAAAATATTAFGPVLGGLLLTVGGAEVWRAVFALNLPLGAGALWLLWRFALPDAGRPGTRIDWPGALLATLALGLMAEGFTREGQALLWLLGAAISAGLFLWREAVTPHPMIRLTMFADTGFALTNLATLVLYIAVTGVMFYLPMTALSVWGISAFAVAAAFLPVSVLITLLSSRTGRLADRVGPGPLMAVGSLLVALGYAGIAINAPAGRFFSHIVPFMVLVGLGMALVVAPLTAAVMAYAKDSEQGAASDQQCNRPGCGPDRGRPDGPGGAVVLQCGDGGISGIWAAGDGYGPCHGHGRRIFAYRLGVVRAGPGGRSNLGSDPAAALILNGKGGRRCADHRLRPVQR